MNFLTWATFDSPYSRNSTSSNPNEKVSSTFCIEKKKTSYQKKKRSTNLRVKKHVFHFHLPLYLSCLIYLQINTVDAMNKCISFLGEILKEIDTTQQGQHKGFIEPNLSPSRWMSNVHVKLGCCCWKFN